MVGNQNTHSSAYGNCKQNINCDQHLVRGFITGSYGRCLEQETVWIFHKQSWGHGFPSSHQDSKDLLFPQAIKSWYFFIKIAQHYGTLCGSFLLQVTTNCYTLHVTTNC